MRAELDAVTTGFGKLPVLAASALKLVRVNAGATALESTNLIDGITIGSVTPAPGTFTTLASTGLATLASATVTGAFTATSGTINGIVVGGVTPAAGTFTTLASTGLATLASATITGALVANGNVTLGDALADTITIGGGSSKNATGNWAFAAPSSGDTLAIANVGGGRAYYAFGALSGGIVQTKTENTSNTASSDSRHIMTVGGTSAGDPYWVAEIPAGTSWAFGADNSDSDKFKISASTALGTSDTIFILPAGNVTIAAPSAGVGLTVNGTAATGRNGVQLSGTTTGFHYLGFDNTSGNALIGIDNSAGAGLMTGTDAYSLVLGTTNARSVWLGTNNIARVQIGSAGNVAIAGPTAGVGFTQAGFAGSDTAIFNGGTSGSFRVTDRGLPYGTSLHNNAGAVTGTTNQYVCSGTYTPTLTNQSNVDSSTAFVCQWMRVGNVVTVSGKFDINPTAAAADTQLGISLPIASDFANLENCGGFAGEQLDGTGNPGRIAADLTNNRAQLRHWAVQVGNASWTFHFTYLIL